MAFNINTFSKNLDTDGVLAENRFDVSFISPGSVQAALPNWGSIDRLALLRAQQVLMPGVALTSQSVNPYGVGISRKQPTNVEFTSNSITFLDDKNNTLYKYFYVWMNSIFDYTGVVDSGLVNTRPSYRVGYKKDDNGSNLNVTNIFVRVYDYTGNIVTVAVMENAFPTSVNDVSLDWSKNNSHFKVTVGFTFDRWYIGNINTISSFNPPVTAYASTLENFVNPPSTILQSLGSAVAAAADTVGNNISKSQIAGPPY
jgi:hypothetical protein